MKLPYLILLFLLISACHTPHTGTIIFTTNGEDFVRSGFREKDGWQIEFTNLYINIVNPEAGTPGGEKALLHGEYLTDLAEGSREALPVVIGKLTDKKTGNYQSLKFSIKKCTSGNYRGYSIILEGTAEKDGERLPFSILLDEELECRGTEGYVGDTVKGLLPPGGTTEVEMTFHMDHIFGDEASGPGEHVNSGSVGFEYFRQFEENGAIRISQQEMTGTQGYKKLMTALYNLPHLGEGHCDCSTVSP